MVREVKTLTHHCCQDNKPVSHSHQLLNHIVDCQASRRPEALFAEFPVSATSFEQGFLKITYGKLANAINRVAWWIVDNLGQSKTHETLAYIGANDLTYPALILGAVKAGYKALLLSPRNSIEAQLHLLQVTNCKVFLVPQPCPPPVTAILKSLDSSFNVLTLPSVDELLQPRCRPFIYNVTLDEAMHDPLVVLHTSGSTGLPKPITWPQSFVPAYAKQLQLSPPDGFESTDHLYKGNRIFVIYPPFHAAYVAHAVINAITNQTTAILPLRGAIPSAQSLAQTAKYNKIDTAMVVPLIIEEMSRSPELLEEIAARIDRIVYTGGDVPQGCGDVVAARMPLINFYGSTEGTSLALIHPEGPISRKDWKYLSFHPDAGAEFRHHADDMHELCIVRHTAFEPHQQIFQTFPKINEFKTRDLFKRHPTKSFLWSHCGRSDDTIVFLTGEKVAPVDMEQYIFSQNPDISGVLIAGSQRFQPVLLIELIQRDETVQMPKGDLIGRFWPSIVHANERLPGHAQITQSHIMFLDPKRPMSRSPKGTIQRAATLEEYQSDLDSFYIQAEQEDITSISGTQIRDMKDSKALLEWFRSIVSKGAGQVLGNDENMFLHGIDSLQALILCREIRREIPSVRKFFDTAMLYANPTIQSLLNALQQLENTDTYTPTNISGPSTDEISHMLARFNELIDEMPVNQLAPAPKLDEPSVWLLTGSTGSAGSYILQSLLESNAKHIYCLNRSLNSDIIQKERNKMKGLSTTFPSSKVTFLTGDLSLTFFGLDVSMYTELSQSVTHIIHNAWTVNFNVPLSFYSSQIEGVLSLTKFCHSAYHRPSFMYLSSVSAVSNLSLRTAAVEAMVDDLSAPATSGYGASKYVSEHIIDRAAQRFGLNAKVARIGQIAGPSVRPGSWNKWEWFPSLIRSSIQVAAIPSLHDSGLGRVDWIAVDTLADIILELTKHGVGEQPGAKVFNVVNPQTTQWTTELLPEVSRMLTRLTNKNGSVPTHRAIEIVSLDDWIEKVKNDLEIRERCQSAAVAASDLESDMKATLASNPAAKLLDFYRSWRGEQIMTWRTEEAQKASPTLKALGKIRYDLIEKWMVDWL